MKISGDKIELSELFTGLILKSGKTKVEVTERDGGFFIQFNGVEIRLIENNPVQIEPLGKMPTFTPHVPVIAPSRITCENLKTNILGGIDEL